VYADALSSVRYDSPLTEPLREREVKRLHPAGATAAHD
jgi:hypothetical protein